MLSAKYVARTAHSVYCRSALLTRRGTDGKAKPEGDQS